MRLGIATSLLSSNRRPASIEADEGPLLALLDVAVCKAFSALCRPVQKNLAVLTVAFLRVLGAVRSGHGQLSLAALFRWRVSNPLLMAATAAVGLVAFPLLHPTWVMVR